MSKRMCFVLSLPVLCIFTFANCLAESPDYIGKALVKGKLAYIEEHYLKFDPSGKIKTATTIYSDPDGKQIAKLDSDFTTSLTSPEHTLINAVSGNTQGVRRDSNKTILFSKNRDSDERRKIIEQENDERTIMGCQGLNYYLLDNIERMEAIKTLPVRFLIPGKLDYYDFTIQYLGESSPGKVDFEITIDSWFLQIFASSLKVQYDIKLQRISRYEGLSNIPDKNGKPQNVVITYSDMNTHDINKSLMD